MYERLRFVHGGLALLLALFVAVAYLPVIDAPYTFDDYPHIVHHPGTQPDTWTDLTEALSHPAAQDRPVARVTFGLNYLVAGLDPTVYHGTNVAIHAGAAVVLFFLLCLLARAPRSPNRLGRNALAFAFAGALIWAIHPANTQAVSYVVQRMASMAGFFYLATLLVFTAWRLGDLRARTALPLLAAFWALAMGSKLNAASAPAACWLLEVAFFTGFTRRNLRLGGILLAGGLGAAAWILAGHLDYLFVKSPRYGFTGVERLLTETRVLWHYVSLLVWPDAARLQIDYDYTVSRGLLTPITTAPAFIVLLLTITLAVAGIHRRRLLWLSSAWLLFLIGSSVESSFIMLDPIFEHRIYLPSALLFAGILAPVFGLGLASPQWTVIRLALLLVVAAVAWQTVERNRQWAQPENLWADALGAGAKEARARANAGLAALHKGRLAESTEFLQTASYENTTTATGPTSDEQLRTSPRLVQVAIMQGRFEEALTQARRALQARPRSLQWAYLYGLSLTYSGHFEKARQISRQMWHRAPDAPGAVLLESFIQERAGAPRAAIRQLRRWLDGHESSPIGARNTVRLQLANTYYRAGNAERAAKLYRKIVRQEPLNWSAWVNLSQVLRASGDPERAAAIDDYLRARDVNIETFKSYAQPSNANAQ